MGEKKAKQHFLLHFFAFLLIRGNCVAFVKNKKKNNIKLQSS